MSARFPWQPGEVDDLPTLGTAVGMLADVSRLPGGPGARLQTIRGLADAFRREFASTGTPDSVVTCDLITLPYPTRFGLFRASRALAPFLAIQNRMIVIRWHDTDGRRRTLLF